MGDVIKDSSELFPPSRLCSGMRGTLDRRSPQEQKDEQASGLAYSPPLFFPLLLSLYPSLACSPETPAAD